MMLYSKNGSIPKPETDGTDGWIEVPEPPTAGAGEEVVWWFPPGWVVRPVKPADEPGFQWNWSQSETQWVKGEVPNPTPDPTPDPTPTDTISGGSATDTVSLGTAGDTITLGTAGPTISV